MQNNILISLDIHEDKSIDQTADIVQMKIHEETIAADRVGIDGVGLGGGVVDILKRKGFNVIDIVSGQKAPELWQYSDFLFQNLRSMMWWAMRESLRKGEIKLAIDNELLVEDLTAAKYEIRGDKTIKVESKDEIKKRIGRSTDYGDAFVYANFIRILHSQNQTDTENLGNIDY